MFLHHWTEDEMLYGHGRETNHLLETPSTSEKHRLADGKHSGNIFALSLGLFGVPYYSNGFEKGGCTAREDCTTAGD